MKISKPVLITSIAIIILLGITAYISLSLKKTPQVDFISVKKANITQAVTADGTVQAAQDLSLSFEQGGTVAAVDVQAGDAVKKGQVLVRLDNKDASAALSQADASLAQAQANYKKVISGASSQDLDVAQKAVDSAQVALDTAQTNLTNIQAQQDTAVNNANSVMLNSTFSAMANTNNVGSATVTITGNYQGTDPGVYSIVVSSSGNGLQFQTSGLEDASGDVKSTPVALGTKGLYIQFSGSVYANDSWTVSIPNTMAANYVSNYNAYQSALQTQQTAVDAAKSQVSGAQAALDQAQAALTAKQQQVQPADIAVAQAQVDAAAAQVQSAENASVKNSLTAPIDGIITSVDTKVGQTIAGSSLAPGPDVVKMISNSKFQIITYISEADIGKIKTGDQASVNLDAYGASVNFPAAVILIDPAATITSGVSAYKTTLEFSQADDRIKEGMGANVTITDQTHQNALVIPATAVIKKGDQDFVLTQGANGNTVQTQIQTGITGLDGNIEVLSGLSEGQKVAYFGNQ